MEGWDWVVLGGGVWLLFWAFKEIHKARVFLRARARRPRYDLAAPETPLPAHLEETAAFVREQLGALGFTMQRAVLGHDATAWHPGWHLVLRHEDRVTWALARPTAIRQQRVMLTFATLHDQGSIALATMQNGDVQHVPPTDAWRATLTFDPVWGDALARHREDAAALEREGHPAWPCDSDTFLGALSRNEWSAWSAAERAGLATRVDDEEMRLTWRGVRRCSRAVTKALSKLQAAAKGTQAAAPDPTAEVVAAFHAGQERHRQRAEPRAFVWGVAIASAAAFSAAAVVFWGASFVPALVVTLLLHEVGHWAAMRAFGYRNTRIFFIPFFGAAAIGTRRDPRLWQEIVVFLAGPLPGLAVGAVLLFVAMGQPWLTELAAVMLALNALNLLPFFPLDGGRVVHRLLAADATWIDVGLRGAASAVFLLGAVALGDYVLGFLGVIGLVGLPNAYRIAAVARALRADGAHRLDDDAQRVAIHRALLAHPTLSRRPVVARTNLATQLEERVRRPEEPLLVRLPFMVAYGGLVAGLVGAGVLVAALSAAGA